MKVLLEIKDSKALQLLETLKSLPYVKATKISNEKATLLKDMKEAVAELKLIFEGTKQAKDADEFQNEL